MKYRHRNAANIKRAAVLLGELAEHVIFVGGTIPALLVTDAAAPDARPTEDVDVIIQVASRGGYYDIEERLRSLGFGPDLSAQHPIICRWVKSDLIIDVMPADENIFGFTNVWYQHAFDNPLVFDMGDGVTVKAINAPLFLCTKIVASEQRDEPKDIEDIIMIIDGDSLLTEIRECPTAIRECLQQWSANRLRDTKFLDNIAWCLPPDEASQAREAIILKRMRMIATLRPYLMPLWRNSAMSMVVQYWKHFTFARLLTLDTIFKRVECIYDGETIVVEMPDAEAEKFPDTVFKEHGNRLEFENDVLRMGWIFHVDRPYERFKPKPDRRTTTLSFRLSPRQY